MGVALTQKQNDVQKEYITLLQSFEKDGFDCVEKLIESDEEDKLCLVISGKPDVVKMHGDYNQTPLYKAVRYNS